MNCINQPFLRHALVSLFLITAGSGLSADVIETANGARLVGTITAISDGKVQMKTDYAGDLVIKQSDVTAMTTDHEVTVRLASGTVIQGRVTPTASGLQISGSDGQLTSSIAKVAATWPAGAEDPDKAALRRHWAYEAGLDVTGKTGNKEQIGTSASVRATLKTPIDTLQFYSSYDRQVADGAKSADQFKAGVDYQNNFSGRKSWYVRDEGGFDRVKGIDLYNIAAAGVGYDAIKDPNHTLTFRTGLSYRYEGYRDPTMSNLSSAGLELGLNHEWQFAESKLVNRISYDPAFSNFGNFRLLHESFYEIPLTVPNWKLRLGVSNDYNSKPGPGLERLDTSYFTRFVLIWQ